MQVNPQYLISMIRQGLNPQQLILSLLEQNRNNPLQENLYKLAKDNNGVEIEKIARNIFAERGLDFDKEFTAFKNKLGL
jgi:hypothetical protein